MRLSDCLIANMAIARVLADDALHIVTVLTCENAYVR